MLFFLYVSLRRRCVSLWGYRQGFLVAVGAIKILVQELDACYPAHHVMNALGILYPQYWCASDAKEMFDKHFHILMDAYNHGKIVGEGKKKLLVPSLIDQDALISQWSLFKTYMKSNSRAATLPSFDVNPLIKIWRVLDSNNNLIQNFGEFLKLAKMAVVNVLGSVVVDMFSQKIYSIDNFPYQKVFDEWFTIGGRGRYIANTEYLGSCTVAILVSGR